MKSDLRRAILVALVMAGASLLALGITPRTFLADLDPRAKLDQIVPRQVGDWQVDTSIVPLQPSPDVQEVLDLTYDETLALTFKNGQGERIMLSLAYGRNQHKGMNTHRPEICYPAQGFKLTTAATRGTVDFRGKPIPVTRVTAAQGRRNEPITYWLLVGDEVTYFGYPQRAAAIRYGLQGVIPDGVLVRVSSIDVNDAAAYALQERFIRDLLGAMDPASLKRLVGVLPAA